MESTKYLTLGITPEDLCEKILKTVGHPYGAQHKGILKVGNTPWEKDTTSYTSEESETRLPLVSIYPKGPQMLILPSEVFFRLCENLPLNENKKYPQVDQVRHPHLGRPLNRHQRHIPNCKAKQDFEE